LCLHRPVERALVAALPEADPLPPRRSEFLVADLAWLGRLAETRSSHWPDWSGAAPVDRSAYVGMRYVIEGSTLGGRVIRRQLDLTLPASGLGATRFFDGVAAGEPDPWAGFWRLVATLGPIDPEAAALAARTLFAEAEALWDAHLSLRGGRTR
jgi:heme oxygenase